MHLPIVTPPTTIRHNRVVKNRKEKIIHSSFIISLFLTLCDSAAEARADWPVACRCSENSEFEAVQSSVVLFTRGERWALFQSRPFEKREKNIMRLIWPLLAGTIAALKTPCDSCRLVAKGNRFRKYLPMKKDKTNIYWTLMMIKISSAVEDYILYRL